MLIPFVALLLAALPFSLAAQELTRDDPRAPQPQEPRRNSFELALGAHEKFDFAIASHVRSDAWMPAVLPFTRRSLAVAGYEQQRGHLRLGAALGVVRERTLPILGWQPGMNDPRAAGRSAFASFAAHYDIGRDADLSTALVLRRHVGPVAGARVPDGAQLWLGYTRQF
ncbi:MAG: hypothetical protein ACXU8N_11070 [Telluria sp.]